MKKLILIFICLFLVGCNHETITNTVIEEHKNLVLAINNPITNIKPLDKKINDYIKNEYDNFIDNFSNINVLNEKAELNIDYTFNIINERFYSVCLFKTIKAFFLPEIKEVKTYLYDIKTKKFLTINDITDNNLSNLFKLNNNSITFYFNENNSYTSTEINYNDLPLKFDVKNKKTTIPTYKQLDKVIDTNKPVVALTFDDGPSIYTKKIVDVLDKYNACATFFILGNKVDLYEETLIDLIKKGNEIGNHSYSHKWLTRLNNNELKDQINDTQNIIKEKLNYESKYLRPTYGSINNRLKNSTDLEIILWNVDTKDWKIKNSSKIANRTISKVNNGDIILMHDTYERTLKAVKKIVPELQKQGYQFVTISQLKEYKLINENR